MPELTSSKDVSWAKVIWTVVVITLAVGVISGGLFWYFYVRQPEEPTSVMTTKQATSSATPSAQKDETTWYKYTNARLGFSMDFPVVSDSYKSSGKNISFQKKVTAFEDGDNVYIAWDKDATCIGNYSQNCEEKLVTNSLETIKKEKSGDFVTWKLSVGNVSNDNELEGFLKKSFGPACTLGNKSPSDQDGVYSVQVNGDGKDWGESKCIINFSYVFKYYPAKNKAVTWDLGMDSSFCKDYYNGPCYDEDIAKTFKFL
jgi:hypothetical protein